MRLIRDRAGRLAHLGFLTRDVQRSLFLLTFFSLFICSFGYDPFYGYPSRVVMNCPLPDACYTSVEVRDLIILPP
jgi:hypothetical protein